MCVQSLLACLTPVSSPDVYVPSSSHHVLGSALGKPRRFQNWRFVFSIFFFLKMVMDHRVKSMYAKFTPE